MVMEKKCSRCRVVKPAEKFSPDKRSKTGLRSWCRACCRKEKRERRRMGLDDDDNPPPPLSPPAVFATHMLRYNRKALARLKPGTPMWLDAVEWFIQYDVVECDASGVTCGWCLWVLREERKCREKLGYPMTGIPSDKTFMEWLTRLAAEGGYEIQWNAFGERKAA